MITYQLNKTIFPQNKLNARFHINNFSTYSVQTQQLQTVKSFNARVPFISQLW